MAYIQHDCFGIARGSALSIGQRPVPRALSSLERQVIALASREPLSSLSTDKRPIARALFGVEPARALADPRLEGLRRFVVLYRHGRPGAAAAGKTMIDFIVFTPDQQARLDAATPPPMLNPYFTFELPRQVMFGGQAVEPWRPNVT